jgi:hypothetical protein
MGKMPMRLMAKMAMLLPPVRVFAVVVAVRKKKKKKKKTWARCP